MQKIAAVLTTLGLSRDDKALMWTWMVAAATGVLSGAINLTELGNYLGVHLTPTELHWVIAICWIISGAALKLGTSPLFDKASTKAIVDQIKVVTTKEEK